MRRDGRGAPGGRTSSTFDGRTVFPSKRTWAPLIAPATSASIRGSSCGVRFSIFSYGRGRQCRPEPGRQVLPVHDGVDDVAAALFEADEDADRSELVGGRRPAGQREAEDGERDEAGA